MIDDHPAEFRLRVLRRVAERNDLDAVAREFGLPADMVFKWLRDNAEQGQPLAPPAPPRPRAPLVEEAAAQRVPAPMDDRGVRDYVMVFASVIVALLLTTGLGFVHLSAAYLAIAVPVGIACGVALFVRMFRRSRDDILDRDVPDTALRLTGMALLQALACTFATAFWVLALASIPHRLVAKRVDVRSQVVGKRLYHSKNTLYCLVAAEPDPLGEWCTDVAAYREARIGQAIVLHASSSWFGVVQKGYDLVPDAPKTAGKTGTP